MDPEKRLVSGKNNIRFRMLQDDTRVQLDLYANLSVDKILLGAATLEYKLRLRKSIPASVLTGELRTRLGPQATGVETR